MHAAASHELPHALSGGGAPPTPPHAPHLDATPLEPSARGAALDVAALGRLALAAPASRRCDLVFASGRTATVRSDCPVGADDYVRLAAHFLQWACLTPDARLAQDSHRDSDDAAVRSSPSRAPTAPPPPRPRPRPPHPRPASPPPPPRPLSDNETEPSTWRPRCDARHPNPSPEPFTRTRHPNPNPRRDARPHASPRQVCAELCRIERHLLSSKSYTQPAAALAATLGAPTLGAPTLGAPTHHVDAELPIEGAPRGCEPDARGTGTGTGTGVEGFADGQPGASVCGQPGAAHGTVSELGVECVARELKRLELSLMHATAARNASPPDPDPDPD